MASRRIDTEIDRLYALPPNEFTVARNALAKTAGADAAGVRGLVKPPIAAWAVNQVYWKHRDVYDALIEASDTLRKVHQAILGGRRADVRDAAKAHDATIDAALKAALSILRDEGHPATDATRQGILTTLRALPADDPPGRLTRALQPGGFEMLSGLSLAGAKASARPAESRPAAPQIDTRKTAEPKTAVSKAEAVQAAIRKAARQDAERSVRDAEQTARRQEFETVRLGREAEKAATQVEQAHEALKAAREALERAEAAATAAVRERDLAVRRGKEAGRALETARRHQQTLRKD